MQNHTTCDKMEHVHWKPDQLGNNILQSNINIANTYRETTNSSMQVEAQSVRLPITMVHFITLCNIAFIYALLELRVYKIYEHLQFEPLPGKTNNLHRRKTKAQISFAVTCEADQRLLFSLHG